MSYYQISSSDLRTKTEELSELNSKFKNQKENLAETEMALKSMWEGEANNNFHNAFLKDAGQMDAFYTAMEQYVSVLETIADRYEMAEAKNAETALTRTYIP